MASRASILSLAPDDPEANDEENASDAVQDNDLPEGDYWMQQLSPSA